MKRILTLVGCFITLTCTCFAQDVIVTKDSRRIDAIVMQVNEDNIRYKHFDNPNGTTYMLQKSDVAAILYQNGKVETFDTENARNQAETSTPVQTQSVQTTSSSVQTQQSQRIQANTSNTVQAQSQRTAQRINSLAFLKGQERLHIIFNYDFFMIDGIPEKDYFAIRGLIVEEWENAKNTTIKTTFLAFLNQSINARRTRLLCGDYPDAPYQATIYVLKNTVGRKKGITCEMVFTQKGNDVPLGKITFSSKSRRFGGVQVGRITYQTRTAFGYAGKKLGKSMARKIK